MKKPTDTDLQNRETAIRVSNVHKDFLVPHEKTTSMKSGFTSFWRKKAPPTRHRALTDINLEIKKGEFFGIVGRNGSGKSTLLKIIARIYQPTRGTVDVNGVLVPFIELGVGFNPKLTGRENVFLNGAILGFSREEIADNYDEIVEFAELEQFMDQKMKNYSSGMKVRLAFSVATILARSDILLVDEVLAVGDAAFQRKCFEYFDYLKEQGKTVVFVSHSMDSVRKYCDRAVLIDDSEITAEGDADSVATQYSKLFVQKKDTAEKSDKLKAKLSPSGQERWGDEMAVWKKITAKAGKASSKDAAYIEITAKGRAREDMAKPIVGFSIKDSKFRQLVGTNTDRIFVKLGPLKKGETFTYSWRVPNIFNRGSYYIDCTIAHDRADQVSDRWPEAAHFTVDRLYENPYPLYLEDIVFKGEV